MKKLLFVVMILLCSGLAIADGLTAQAARELDAEFGCPWPVGSC